MPDMFLECDIKGESIDEKAKDQIQVLSWSWGASQVGTLHQPGTTTSVAGRAAVQDLTITKYVDKATPEILKFLTQGKKLDKAVLRVRHAAGAQEPYLEITMKPVFLVGYNTGGGGAEDRLTESVTLHFGEVKLDYQQWEDGKKKGGKITAQYTVNQGKTA